MSATSLKSGTGRPSRLLGRSSASRSLDPLLQWGLSGMAAFILLLIAFFFVRLFVEAKPAFDEFGYFGFTFGNDWNVAKNIYGALPLLTGTLITSAIALVIGVPVAVGVAVGGGVVWAGSEAAGAPDGSAAKAKAGITNRPSTAPRPPASMKRRIAVS